MNLEGSMQKQIKTLIFNLSVLTEFSFSISPQKRPVSLKLISNIDLRSYGEIFI